MGTDWRSDPPRSNALVCGWRRALALDPNARPAAYAAMLIYKIFRPAEWAELQSRGATPGAPVDRADGYVHFSTAEQVADTLAKHFAGEEGLTLLACEADALADDLRWEMSRGGQDFPHLYRELRIGDVIWSRPILTGAEGHDLPDLT